MLVKIYDEQAFQVLNDSFTVSPSTTGYDLYISADGVSYSKFTSVPAGVTRQFVQMSEGNFYKLVGNQGTVTVNWIKCLNGQGGGGTGNIPIASETTLGGVKVGNGLSIDETGVLSSSGKEQVDIPVEIHGDLIVSMLTQDELAALYTKLAANYNGYEVRLIENLDGEATTYVPIESYVEEDVTVTYRFDIAGSTYFFSISPDGTYRGEIVRHSGGGSVVELTQAEYDALDEAGEIDYDTVYVISDAEEIDLNGFATKEQVDNIETEVLKKATAVAITATNGIPKWNEQGIITGLQTNAGSQNIYINDQTNTIIKGGTWTAGTARLYSPANAGNKGQMLMSNGSGAPVWSDYKFVFLTQDAYDNLATKDSRTVYIIIEE